MTSLSSASALIDLDALTENYRLLRAKSGTAEAAAVVKANAYGLGAAVVSQTLAKRAGCQHFFVAALSEGIELRAALPDTFIGAFYGVNNREDAEAADAYRLVPVLNTLAQLAVWRDYAHKKARILPAIIHVDTGMTRVGISHAEAVRLAQEPQLLQGLDVLYFMSHLACAEDTHHPLNTEQLQRFEAMKVLFPQAKFSFANSSGIFLGEGYHQQLTRPGMALYGLNPTPAVANPMRTVVTLQAPLLQVHTVEKDEQVGYGATYQAKKGSRLAVAAIGYADGLLRSLSNRGEAVINGHRAPIAGIVSMDLTILDVTHLPEEALAPGAMAEFYGAHLAADDVATQAGTIGYELFTSITTRVQRRYIG